MELIRLRDSRGKIFDTAMKLYEKSFPKYERRSYDAQQRAMYDEGSILTLYMMRANL